ncbi:recombinase [Roseibium sp. M-1]
MVAAELESRWNQALIRVGEIESKITAHDTATPRPSPVLETDFTALAADLQAVWSAPTTDAKLKKRIVRTVIQEVVADIDDDASQIVLAIHWIGGAHTELRLPKRRRGQRNSTSSDIIAAMRQLVLIASDDVIAGILNRNGLVTGHGNRWTRERVTAHRSHHKIPVFRAAPDGNEPWLNLNKAARLLGVAPKTLRLAAEACEIEGVHPLPDSPWIFSRAELRKPRAQQIVRRARKNPKYPAGSHSDQQNLFTSTT